MLSIGDSIPNLAGTTGDNAVLRLDDFRGKFLVVYFYPKDNTPGCTNETRDFRDRYEQFTAHNALIFGVSRDSTRSHANFQSKLSLPFPLIADTDETWCRTFDVIQEKQLYGRRYLGIVRSTFLIDPHGKLRREWRNLKVPDHAQTVLDALITETK